MSAQDNPILAQPSPIILSANDIDVECVMDLSNNVGINQTVSSPVSTLTDLDEGTTISLPDNPFVASKTVVQKFRPSTQLQGGHSYKWGVEYTLDVDNTLYAYVQINVNV